MPIRSGGWLVIVVASAALVQGAEISFKRTQIDPKFRSEGTAVGDFNGDGKLDISAGSVYYAAPDWKMNLVREKAEEFKPTAYSNSFMNFAADLNGDKRTDLIVVEFPGKETVWLEQPESPGGGPWKRHTCAPVSNNESPQFTDIDGDGQRDLLMPVAISEPGSTQPVELMAYLTRPSDPTALWTVHPISARGAPCTGRFSHGLGAGDINQDGRIDILCPAGWWEAPAAGTQGEWPFHTAAPGQPPLLGEDCSQMYVFDFDGDGDNDVLSASAHRLGIWWHEQGPTGFTTHEIARDFSQSHALVLADINGDGLPDFVTGKRFWAHGPEGDIDPGAPAVVFWYELRRVDGKPTWIPHEVDHDSGVGTQFEVADVNGDGLLDIVTANKKGVYYFEQQRK